MPKFTVVGPMMRGTEFEIHRSGCRDIRKSEQMSNGSGWEVEADSVGEVIQEELLDLNAEIDDFTVNDFKVHNCAHQASRDRKAPTIAATAGGTGAGRDIVRVPTSLLQATASSSEMPPRQALDEFEGVPHGDNPWIWGTCPRCGKSRSYNGSFCTNCQFYGTYSPPGSMELMDKELNPKQAFEDEEIYLCPECQGTGESIANQPELDETGCPNCNSEGEISRQTILDYAREVGMTPDEHYMGKYRIASKQADSHQVDAQLDEFVSDYMALGEDFTNQDIAMAYLDQHYDPSWTDAEIDAKIKELSGQIEYYTGKSASKQAALREEDTSGADKWIHNMGAPLDMGTRVRFTAGSPLSGGEVTGVIDYIGSNYYTVIADDGQDWTVGKEDVAYIAPTASKQAATLKEGDDALTPEGVHVIVLEIDGPNVRVGPPAGDPYSYEGWFDLIELKQASKQAAEDFQVGDKVVVTRQDYGQTLSGRVMLGEGNEGVIKSIDDKSAGAMVLVGFSGIDSLWVAKRSLVKTSKVSEAWMIPVGEQVDPNELHRARTAAAAVSDYTVDGRVDGYWVVDSNGKNVDGPFQEWFQAWKSVEEKVTDGPQSEDKVSFVLRNL